MKDKYYVMLNYDERQAIIECLAEMKNKLIRQGRYTDGIDDVLIKVINANTKRFVLLLK